MVAMTVMPNHFNDHTIIIKIIDIAAIRTLAATF